MYQGAEIKAEFIVENGEITKINFKNVPGKKRFDVNKRKDFEIFIKPLLKTDCKKMD